MVDVADVADAVDVEDVADVAVVVDVERPAQAVGTVVRPRGRHSVHQPDTHLVDAILHLRNGVRSVHARQGVPPLDAWGQPPTTTSDNVDVGKIEENNGEGETSGPAPATRPNKGKHGENTDNNMGSDMCALAGLHAAQIVRQPWSGTIPGLGEGIASGRNLSRAQMGPTGASEPYDDQSSPGRARNRNSRVHPAAATGAEDQCSERGSTREMQPAPGDRCPVQDTDSICGLGAAIGEIRSLPSTRTRTDASLSTTRRALPVPAASVRADEDNRTGVREKLGGLRLRQRKPTLGTDWSMAQHERGFGRRAGGHYAHLCSGYQPIHKSRSAENASNGPRGRDSTSSAGGDRRTVRRRSLKTTGRSVHDTGHRRQPRPDYERSGAGWISGLCR